MRNPSAPDRPNRAELVDFRAAELIRAGAEMRAMLHLMREHPSLTTLQASEAVGDWKRANPGERHATS